MSSTPPLTPPQRIQLAALLRARAAALRTQLDAQRHGLSQAERARDIAVQDADDATQNAAVHEVEAIVGAMESGELDAVTGALARIDGNAYGLCLDCEAPIPFERLRVEPQALRCAPCESVHERKR